MKCQWFSRCIRLLDPERKVFHFRTGVSSVYQSGLHRVNNDEIRSVMNVSTCLVNRAVITPIVSHLMIIGCTFDSVQFPYRIHINCWRAHWEALDHVISNYEEDDRGHDISRAHRYLEERNTETYLSRWRSYAQYILAHLFLFPCFQEVLAKSKADLKPMSCKYTDFRFLLKLLLKLKPCPCRQQQIIQQQDII